MEDQTIVEFDTAGGATIPGSDDGANVVDVSDAVAAAMADPALVQAAGIVNGDSFDTIIAKVSRLIGAG